MPTVVPVEAPAKAMICLMCFSKLFRASHVLRMFLTDGPMIISAQDYCAIDLTIIRVTLENASVYTYLSAFDITA